MSDEGHITHATVARINVERGKGSVTLRLWGWSLSPAAVMTDDEARTLITRLQAALAPPKTKATVPVAPEDYSDIA